MKRIAQRLSCAVAAGLVACAGAPSTHYYELSVAAGTSEPPAALYDVVVAAVSIPDALDRTELVVERTATRADILDGHRWVSPLSDQIARTLTADLQAALPLAWVSRTRSVNVKSKRFSVAVDIERLSASKGGQVLLVASWVLQDEGGQLLMRERSLVEVPIEADGFEAIPPAMSAAVRQLAAKIGRGVAGRLNP
jgi:uncharacterized protein